MALTAKKVYAILKRQISDMEAKLNSPVRYRGTVATADLLPLNPDIGDMYNIESKSIYGEAGMNVAWNGVVWDTMGAPIDMSLYLTKEEAETVIQRLVTEYFEKNPVKPGATTEQAQQIEQNKTDIASLKTETGSLKEEIANKEDSKNLYRGTNFVQSEVELEKATTYYCHSELSDNVKKTSGDSSYDSVKVEVKSGYVYRVSTYVKPDDNMFCLAVLVDEDGTMTAYKRNNTGSAISYIDEPIDVGSAKYIIVTSYISKIAPTIKEAKLEFIYDYAESLLKKIDDANIEELPTFEKDIDSFNPIKETIEITIGEAWGSNGEPRTASAWKRTNKIAVIPNATYKIYDFIGEVCMYDSTGTNGKFTQLKTAQNVEKVITIPSDRHYIAFDSTADSISNMSVYRTTPNESELNGVPMHSDELSVTLDNFKRNSVVNIICPLRGKTIVNMGDSIFGIFNPPFDISTYLSEKTGATTYNCGFGGSSMATHG